MGSKGSIVFRELLAITTIWGICSSLDSQPKRLQRIPFGHSFDTAAQGRRAVLDAFRSEGHSVPAFSCISSGVCSGRMRPQPRCGEPEPRFLQLMK